MKMFCKRGKGDFIGIFIAKQKPFRFLYRNGFFGASCWARTNDLRINSPALYRLS